MIWNQKKRKDSGTLDGLSSNLEFEFERNQQLGFKHQTSIQVQKKDHVYKLMLKHGAYSSKQA